MATITNVDIRQAWLNLASAILCQAIEEVRTHKDPRRRARSKAFLLSPEAKLLFDSLDTALDFDLEAWVKAGCPQLNKHR